ncbi:MULTISPECIES: hypothetical protein [unclassified Streptomyces]|uniref:hypothetical protein n=1 Tax=unclassified Streptomyces TaxID=2593676 RepID=UPI0011E6F340|nr:hypothetical protein [Streptomyces sp. sk2.1]TXS73974.1 hypothetical protein EAO76_16980 [Streptomyces sp. sk2.1]
MSPSPRRKYVVVAAVAALALAGGVLARGIGNRDGSDNDLDDACHGSVAVEEARNFFDGAELEGKGHTGEWVGHETDWCSVRAGGDDRSATLRLQIRPAAAHRSSGAAEEPGAAPIGHGWNGSVAVHGRPRAAVLVDCAPLAGKGLLVLTEATREADELTTDQIRDVARLATETARRAAERFDCEGALGTRPETVDRTGVTTRPAAGADATCRDVVSSRNARLAHVATVDEYPAGRALTEECRVNRGEHDHVRLNAYYGPSALQEKYLDDRYPGSVTGSRTRSHACRGALGTAYFKLTPPKRGDGRPAPVDAPTAEVFDELLAAFARSSAARHGCPMT